MLTYVRLTIVFPRHCNLKCQAVCCSLLDTSSIESIESDRLAFHRQPNVPTFGSYFENVVIHWQKPY